MKMKKMRKIFLLCIVGMLSGASQGNSQAIESAHLYGQVFDDEGLLVNSLSLDKSAAQNFDLKKYILDNKAASRLKVSNILRSEMRVDKHLYDSKDAEETSGDFICVTTQVSAAPALGVVVKSKDNLNGVVVERVIAGGPAHVLGIGPGDIIYDFNEAPINSYCDLKMAVASSQIGALAPLHYERNGRSVNEDITVGARSINTHNYAICDEKIEEIAVEGQGVLATYPNPTRKSSFVNYRSELTSPVSLSIMDMNGLLIHSEEHAHFSGELRLEYTFEQAAQAGVYLFIIEQKEQKHYSRVLFVRS